jgi:hypothetical protein
MDGKWLGWMGLGNELKKWRKRHRAKGKRRKTANEAGSQGWEALIGAVERRSLAS